MQTIGEKINTLLHSFLLQFQQESRNGKIRQTETFSLYPCDKIDVCLIGRLFQTLLTAAEPAAQHSEAGGMDRRSQEHDSRTIKTCCFPVFSKLSQIQVFSQVKTGSHRDSTTMHWQEIDALPKGCPCRYTENNSTLWKEEKLNF